MQQNTMMQQRWFLLVYLFAGVLSATVFLGTTVEAQTLSWGVNGVGGSGEWDDTTANWFDGSQNVAWPSGGDAIFGGASGGTVTSASPFFARHVVSSMTFNTPGYVIEGDVILSGEDGLTVTTNVDATISSSLNDSTSSGSFLVKNGVAALSISANHLDAVQVNQGELRISRSFFGDVTLADAPGAMITIDSSLSMGSLSGGGPSGGVVRPNDQASTEELTVLGDGNFGGRLEDNGSGTLALSFRAAQTLTNVHTYSGSTSIVGELAFAGNGSALNSSVSAFGTLLLDNRDTVVPNRISDSLPFELRGGAIQLEGNNTTPVEEVLGELSLSGVSSITVNQPGSAAAQLTFAGLQRNFHATLNVSGPGVHIAGLSNDATGIVPPYITAGTEWATVGGDSRIAPLSTYATDINAGAPSDHVKLAGGGTTALAGDTTRASLNFQNSTAAHQTLDLAGRNLDLTSGGLLSSGAGPNSIHSGSLSTPAQEMVVTTYNDFTIGASVVDTGGPTRLTKTGPGILTLRDVNTYSGPTTIMQGTVVVASDANLGSGSTIDLKGGRLKAAGSFSSGKGINGSGGSIDTAGFDLVFSGPSFAVFKTGPGTLTLAGESDLNRVDAGVLKVAGSPTGLHFVEGGVLEIANAIFDSVFLLGGTLQAAGTLRRFDVFPSFSIEIPILDLGGPAAATLTTESISLAADGGLQVNFGLGSEGSDSWAISHVPFRFANVRSGAIQFAFHNLGGVTTGVDYPLMSFEDLFFAPSNDPFAFAPASLAAGWSGEFTATRDGVFVRFATVPEPSVTAMLLLQGAVLAFAGRRLLRNRKTRRKSRRDDEELDRMNRINRMRSCVSTQRARTADPSQTPTATDRISLRLFILSILFILSRKLSL